MNLNTLDELIDISRPIIKGSFGDTEDIFCRSNIPVFHVNIPRKMNIYEMKRECIFNEKNEGDKELLLPFNPVKIIDCMPHSSESLHDNAFCFSSLFGVLSGLMFSRKYDGTIYGACLFALIDDMVASIDAEVDFHIKSVIFMVKPKLKILHDEELVDELRVKIENKIMSSSILFCDIVNHPRHFIAKVTPDNAKGRSVEWVQRKTKYIILGAEHGKLLRDGKQTSFDGTITRAMHWRRAHLRQLVSERYTTKRGQKIWVKSSWVGPEEWSDKTGNRYKIITKNKTTLNN